MLFINIIHYYKIIIFINMNLILFITQYYIIHNIIHNIIH